MPRPPAVPPEEKTRLVLSILAGEISVADAARRAKLSEQSVLNWKRQFIEAGRQGVTDGGRPGPNSRERQLLTERAADVPQRRVAAASVRIAIDEVTELLDDVADQHGVVHPVKLVTDNGPAYKSTRLRSRPSSATSTPSTRRFTRGP